jgi:CRP/FNR family transcriptional regulator, cyclic AMP receptor protein
MRQVIDCNQCGIRSACFTSKFTDAERQALQPCIVRKTIHRGDVLVEEGAVSEAVRTVKLGRVFSYRRGLDGRRRPVGMAGRAASFGLFGVFGQKTPVSIVAASTTRVCDIPVASLRDLAERSPILAHYLGLRAAEACSLMAAWSEAMRLRGIGNQLAYSLLLLADTEGLPVIELPSHVALAELLGTSRETIARSLALLEKEGGIRRLERKNCEVYRSTLLGRLAKAEAN